MKKTKILVGLLTCLSVASIGQVNVDVNLNMKHSVDGESNFGRERRMTIHSSLNEGDWDGHEDKLNYLINDLDVYFGRETGSATWKMAGVEEDPEKPGWANETQMKEHGKGLNQWYDSEDFALRRQYETKSNMIMGTNSHTAMYPHLSYFDGFGRGADGWYVKTTEAASDWVAKYLKNYFAQSDGDIGQPLPTYWECTNEPDMDMLNASFGMIVSSLERNWEYHKFVARDVREKLGAKAPKIGGMCWGLLDLYKADAIPSRVDGTYWDNYSSPEAIESYTHMLKGVGEQGGVENPGVGLAEWPKAWDNKGKEWWQWDYLYQGFIDFAGKDMDFYSVHMYDWPNANIAQDKANTRGGGHTEATLDLFEWYDHQMFDEKKEIVMSEFGAVSRDYILSLANGERDWPFIKSFNQMQMQLLERPSHVVYSMPFAPAKAVWGASFSGNNVIRYEGATLLEPRGSWTGDEATWTMNEPSGGWGWSKIIHFFELWKDVDGTRLDTKSSDNDVQVDAYVKNNHVYLILNNTQDFNKSLNLNSFGENGNVVSNVELRHLYLGDDNIPVYTVADMTSAPSQVTLKPNSTIVLDYTYASNVAVNQESKESKYMCEPLAGGTKNDRGTQLCHTAAQSSITATINGVQKPAEGEAIIRVGGFFTTPSDGTLADGTNGVRVKTLTVNGNSVIVESDNFVSNTRGYGVGSYKGGWFGVLEIECPAEFLVDGKNTVYFERYLGVEFTTIMIQTFDMSATPGRTSEEAAITGLSFEGLSEEVMDGATLGLVPVFAPENTTTKGLTWTSSNSNVISVDENGIVTALAASGNATITATSTANGSISSSISVKAVPFQTSTVTGITITQGASISVDQYLNTKLDVVMTPSPEVAPEVVWSTSDEDVVSILSDGTIVGTGLGQTASITATVKGTNVSDQILVSVQLADGETISGSLLPEFITPLETYTFDVPVEIMGARTVLVELLKNGSVIGSGTENVDAIGDEVANVTLNLSSLPAVSTGYEIRLTLKDGNTVLDTKTSAIEMRAPINVTGVTLPDGPIDMVKLATKTLRATIAPSNASDQRVTWSSANTTVASIDENGKVSAKATGSTLITVTTVDQSKTATLTINVVEFNGTLVIEAEDFDAQGGPQADIGISDTGISNVQTQDYVEYIVYIPETGNYTASFWISSQMTTPALEFFVDGTSVGSKAFTPSGDWDVYQEVKLDNLIAITEGEHTLKVLASGTEQWQWNMDRFELVLDGDYEPILPTSITVTPQTLSLSTGGTSQLSENILPSNATNKGVTWTSNNTSVATVNSFGVVTAMTEGTATITVTTNEGGKTATSVVTVNSGSNNILVSGVSLSPTTSTLDVGDTQQLTTTVEPSTATNKAVTYSSSNANIVSVTSTGLLTANSVGTAIVTVNTEDGNKTATCTVTVSSNNGDEVTLVIEAESFTSTGGTFNDGQVAGNGVNNAGTTINWVNAGDYANYTITVVEAGEYEIEYLISTPMDNAQVQIAFDGTTASTDNVVNNGQWDAYQTLIAANTVLLSAGTHDVTITATGTNNWQWNLDKVTLTKVGDTTDGGDNGDNNSGEIQLTNVGESITLEQGDTFQLEYNSSTYPNVHFNTNSGYAAVDWDTGLITASSISNGHSATITIYDDGGSGQTDAVIVYVVAQGTLKDAKIAAGIKDQTEDSPNNLVVYPNPIKDIVNVELSVLHENAKLALYNNTGNVVLTQKIQATKTSVRVSDLPSGLYILKIKNGNNITNKTIIKK